MRSILTPLIVALVLAGSAFGGNIALPSLGVTATCGGSIVLPNYPNICYLIYPYPSGTQYLPSNAIDGDPATKWIAAGGTQDPYLLITFPALETVDYINVSGVGNPGWDMDFSLYVGGAGSTVASMEAGTPIGSYGAVGLPGGASWTTSNFTVSSQIQYVLLDVTEASGWNGGGAGWDDGYANQIWVDSPIPEPGTFGLLGAALLALGFTLRSRRSLF